MAVYALDLSVISTLLCLCTEIRQCIVHVGESSFCLDDLPYASSDSLHIATLEELALTHDGMYALEGMQEVKTKGNSGMQA
jgi:hypothetical protein